MRLRPRHLTQFSSEEEDREVLERWGLSRWDAVGMAAVSSQLTRLMAEESRPPTDPGLLVSWMSESRHPAQESRLEEAIAIATRAEVVHAMDDAWPHGLADQLIGILDHVFSHQQREQAVVFPILLRGIDALPDRTVDEMVEAHEALLAQWREVGRLTGGFVAPVHACAAWRLLYALCFKLQYDCQEQVCLENRMLLAGREARPPG